MSSGGNFIVSAPSALGPWSEPVRIAQPGIDPSLFFDEDGQYPEGPHLYRHQGYYYLLLSEGAFRNRSHKLAL